MGDKRLIVFFLLIFVSYHQAAAETVSRTLEIPEWGILAVTYEDTTLNMAGLWSATLSFTSMNPASFYCDMSGWQNSSSRDVTVKKSSGSVSVELIPLKPGQMELPEFKGFLTERNENGELLRQQAWQWQPPALEIISLFGKDEPLPGDYFWTEAEPFNSDFFSFFYIVPVLFLCVFSTFIYFNSQKMMIPYINWDYRIINPEHNHSHAVYLYNHYRYFLPDNLRMQLASFCFESEDSVLPDNLHADIRSVLVSKGVCQ